MSSVSPFTVAAAHAHEFRPAALALKELGGGRFAVTWSPPLTTSGIVVRERPQFPAHCREGAGVLDCGEEGLVGDIRFSALAANAYTVVVQIEWQGGERLVRTVGRGQEAITVNGVPKNASFGVLARLAGDYARLGVEHILTGIDHLLFVLGLILVVGFRSDGNPGTVPKPSRDWLSSGKAEAKPTRNPLLWTITAFTLAHSITLAAAALGHASLPQPPVEAAIALSILLVAVEAARDRDSLTRRMPWAVAFGFGLLHGFGFAGALADVGLPPHQTPLALLFFNVGVELGQLASIGVVFVAETLGRRLWGARPRVRTAVVYVMGTAAAYWTIERVIALTQTG